MANKQNNKWFSLSTTNYYFLIYAQILVMVLQIQEIMDSHCLYRSQMQFGVK